MRELLRQFVSSHSKLSFFGLALTEASNFPLFTDEKAAGYDPQLRVTGEATEKQVIKVLCNEQGSAISAGSASAADRGQRGQMCRYLPIRPLKQPRSWENQAAALFVTSAVAEGFKFGYGN